MTTLMEKVAEAQLRNPELQGHNLYVEAVHADSCPEAGLVECDCDPDVYIVHPQDEGLMLVLEGGKIERCLDS